MAGCTLFLFARNRKTLFPLSRGKEFLYHYQSRSSDWRLSLFPFISQRVNRTYFSVFPSVLRKVTFWNFVIPFSAGSAALTRRSLGEGGLALPY